MLFIHFKTLFSFRFYHRLLQLNTKQTVLFALYLYVLAVIVLFLFTGSLLHKNLPVFLKNFPQVTFENGVLTAPAETVSAPIPGTDFKVVFDTSAKMPPSAEELLKQNTLVWVHKNSLYVPSSGKLQSQELPPSLNFTSSQEVIEKNKGMVTSSLRAALFIISLPLLALTLLFDFAMAVGVVLFFNIWRNGPLPKTHIIKLAVFLLGPLTMLWLVRLWVNIPLFSMARLLLCIIYTQQIFNTLPEVTHEN